MSTKESASRDDRVSAKESNELRLSGSGLDIWLMVKALKIAVATVVNSSKLVIVFLTSVPAFYAFNIVHLAEPMWWLIFKYFRSIISYLQF